MPESKCPLVERIARVLAGVAHSSNAEGNDSSAGEALGWMTTIARHRAIEWLRQPGNATPRTSNETSPREEVSAGDITERSVLFDQLLSSLSAEQRESLLLIYVHGMTQEEVSTALDVPLGTVKSRVRRGLIALKELLDS